MSTIVADLDNINQISQLDLYCQQNRPVAILCDMDGTLLSSEPLHVESTQIWLNNKGISVSYDELNEIVLGRDDQSIYNDLCTLYPQIQGPKFIEEKHDLFEELVKAKSEVVMIPNPIMEFLKRQKSQEIKLALVTASTQADMDLILNANGLSSFFDLKISANQVNNIKPHPEAYLKSMESFAAAPAQCLILEDSPTGLRAATQTGAPIFKISWFNSLH